MFHAFQVLPLLAQSTDPWADTFFGLDAEKRFVLMIIAIGCTTGVICTVVGCVSGAITSIHRRRLDHELKQDLLDRGMNAEEVSQVVEASAPNDFLDRAVSNSKKWGRKWPPVRANKGATSRQVEAGIQDRSCLFRKS